MLLRIPLTLACLLLAFSFSAAAEKPKLAIVLVFDQMRGDYIARWWDLYPPGGFKELCTNGTWFTNCHYPYATTATGPGHASILTGTCPDKHGIINNSWYDRTSRTTINCVTSTRYDRVPPFQKRLADPTFKEADEEEKDGKARGFPDRLLSPTLGDVLKEKFGNQSKVFGISFKDRSALLPVGKRPDGTYWLDSTDGMMITSTYYRDSVHPFIKEINDSRFADRWFDKNWDRLRNDLDYSNFSGADDQPGESKGVKQGTTFPHPMNGGEPVLTKKYYDTVFNSPFGNELLWEVAKGAIVREKLGQRDGTDLLTISFSSNDTIGHAYGPDSQEVLDVTLRSDRLIAQMIEFLNQTVGSGNYVIALSADHGICPLPEVSRQKGIDAARIPSKDFLGDVELHLSRKFGPLPDKTRWLEAVTPPWIYVNAKAVTATKAQPEEVEREIARYLETRPGVELVIPSRDLKKYEKQVGTVGQLLSRSYYPGRSGEIAFALKPYHLLGSQLTGTNHGSAHPYDTHVPLVFYGKAIKAQKSDAKVTPEAMASALAEILNVSVPRDAEFQTPVKISKD